MGICSARDDSDEGPKNTDQQKEALIQEQQATTDTTPATGAGKVVVSIQWCGG
eukprot:CAMPEP_0197023988 /NCGR_PEP_ID=MMETSP1384-20130603/4649_1 /TAXON_ID=29189 /ORGANISM="Ammonia sp." /LENGTH=52 /DNA_ID=CAMNT_0042452311 /DNA_START=46 /DNA_END=204 /DNA_ORIENTATION=+